MKLSFTTATLAAAAMLAAPALGQVIVDDNFVDGLPTNSGAAGEAAFFTTSSGDALGDIASPGVLDFASGTSGRAIHTTFAPQTLANEGDVLSVSYTFTTPATVGTNEDFRVGLFNTLGANLSDNIAASSGAPNALLNNLPGISGEFDINTADADIALRTHDVNSVNGTGPTGRLLTTTGGFDFRASGDNNGFAIAANTQYTGGLTLELDANGDVLITQTLLGGLVDETYATILAVADDGADAGINTLTFDLLGFSVTSGAFGSVNNVGEADNGLDFNNVNVTFTSAVAVPEPASFALLAVGAAGLLGSRRRKA